MRSEHRDPEIPPQIEARDLHPAARNELKTLQADLQERVAMHLATVALLIDDDPELAHQHALSASRRAGRIPVTRETLAVTAYRTGDFALALRELRTYRRLTGSDAHLALMIDCERGLGRPEKAIETGLAADRTALDTEDRVQLAIAMSGARLDLGQTQQALFELEIPELQTERAYSWSPELFAAYSVVLEDLGREEESQLWRRRAMAAEAALQDHYGQHDVLEVLEIHETPEPFGREDPSEDEPSDDEPSDDELSEDELSEGEHSEGEHTDDVNADRASADASAERVEEADPAEPREDPASVDRAPAEDGTVNGEAAEGAADEKEA